MLKIENLSYKTILRNFSYLFAPGKLYALLGPNGAGKTTLLKNLCRIQEPTEGTIYWNEKDLALLDRRRLSQLLTLVPQGVAVAFDYTVEEFVAMSRYGKSRAPELIHQALEAADAKQFLKTALRQLSQGERQRVYIARALATEVPILLLDEPTAHLDAKHQRQLWNLMKKLTNQGKVVLVATHDLLYSSHFCDEAILLDKGELVRSGQTREVFDSQILNCALSDDRTQILTPRHS